MRSRALAAALLMYLALDFSNPLMPGAVSFVSGEIETVEGASSRAPDTPAPVVAAAPRADVEKPREWRDPRRLDVHGSVRVTPRFFPRARPSMSSGDALPSPDDD